MDVNRRTRYTAVGPCADLEINTNMSYSLGLSEQTSTLCPSVADKGDGIDER